MTLKIWEDIPEKLRFLLLNIAVGFAYFITAQIGLKLAFEHSQVSPLWPPSGLAVAAIFLFRNKLLLGIFLGATFTNISTAVEAGNTLGYSVVPGVIVGIGNTLEAWGGVWLYRKVSKDEFLFNKIKTIVLFMLLCGVVGGVIAATIGVFTITSFGLAPKEIFMTLLTTWWVGDLGGILVVAPAFIVLKRYWSKFKCYKVLLEFFLYFIAVSILSYFVFHQTLIEGASIGPSLIYLVIPLIVIVSIRVGNLGVGLINGAIALFATMGTVNGLGPFSSSPNTTVLLLNIFLASNYLIGFVISSLWNNLKISRLEVLQNAKMAGLGEVASILAHELGNPIHMIMNYAEIIKQESKNSNEVYSEKTLKAIDKILNYSDRTQQIIKSNRNFYQNHKLNIQEIDLKNSLNKLRELLSIKFMKSSTEFVVKGNDVSIEGDLIHIEQAFYNVINNSLDAFLSGPELNRQNLIQAEIKLLNGVVDVIISDNGPGIPNDILDRIFTPFVTKKNTGLGLSLVASIVSAHEGEVHAYNNPEGGASFKLSFPVSS